LLFNNTGSFFNPGIAGGFLAFSICILLYFSLKLIKQSVERFFFICSIPLIFALTLTNSRAGWLSALVGSMYLLWYSENIWINQVKEKIKGSLFIKLILITIFIGGIFFIYQHKKALADGRLFIWANSVAMLKDKPLTEHGVGMFREKYPIYQADYFIKNPDSNRSMVAGNPSRPFNEYVSVLTMQGLIGFFFLIAIFFSVFLYKDVTLREKRKRAFLLAFCVFAFFPIQQFILDCLFYYHSLSDY
ncbi:MAG: O-antigen ligase family protein, partial [Odoribacter sp.]|nr:O-antigen ligase family protein [Odoribacter sp.]